MTEMSRPLRLAVVNQHDGGGATAAAREVLEWGPGRGFSVTWHPSAGEEAPDRLLATLEEERPDLVHLHCFYQAYGYDILPALCARFRVVFTVHDVAPVNQYGVECWECYRNSWCFGCPALGPIRRWRPNYRVLNRLRKRRLNRRSRCHLVYPSEWMRRRMARSELGAQASSVIPYGVDTRRFHPGPAHRADLGMPHGPIALFAGNMYSAEDHRKGLPDLLAQWPEVRSRVPGATLCVAGKVIGLAESSGVVFLGDVPPEQLPDVYRAADLFVLPTRGDNLPVAVLEAQASALPVVATRVGGVPEEVLDGETGRLVPPGDQRALAEAVVSLLLDSEARDQMGKRARTHVEGGFAREVSAEMHERLYRELVGGDL